MASSGDSAIELGTYDHGIRFRWRASDHVLSAGRLEIDLWDGENTEGGSVELGPEDALTLAQWINEWLGRE